MSDFLATNAAFEFPKNLPAEFEFTIEDSAIMMMPIGHFSRALRNLIEQGVARGYTMCARTDHGKLGYIISGKLNPKSTTPTPTTAIDCLPVDSLPSNIKQLQNDPTQ